MLRQRCKPDGNWVLPAYKRGWFTFKAVICLLLGREALKLKDWVEVAHSPLRRTYSYEWGEGGEFDYLGVAHRGWRYVVGWDGWP